MMWRFDRFGDAVAVKDDQGVSLTYAQLARESRTLCSATDGKCLVFILCENTLGSFLGYTAFLEGGVVPAMLSASVDPELLRSLYDCYRPAYLWAPEGFAWEQCESVYQRFGYQLLKTPFGAKTPMHNDLALLLTTSGSTGSPKFVRQSYRNIRANTDSIVEYLGLTAQERPITTLPMQYTYGLSILNSHLDVGATILLTNHPITRREFWDFFRQEEATSFGGVPYTYEMLDRMRFTRIDLPSLRTLTQAGGKLQPDLHRRFATWCQETGRQFIVMYGQCEATARMAYLPWPMSLEKCGSMGIAIPGGRFELVDGNGDIITQPHQTGELRYHGENVTLGYAQCLEDLAKGDERGGVLETGDMAQVDEDGYYTIVGRKKRFLKMFGNRVNLDEVERMLKAAFPQGEVACAGRDDHLTLFSTCAGDLPAMRQWISEKTGINQNGFYPVALEAIPKNEAGKTLYRELEKYDG